MYRSLILNTAISALAYFAISAVGIVVVSWLVGAYGLAAYGTITLARLFLPTGLASLVDLGAAENASHAVAMARGSGDWDRAGATLAALAIVIFVISLLPCGVLLISAPMLSEWFAAQGKADAAFNLALQYTALSLPVALVGLIAEGVIRGFERYGLARGIEIAASLAYGVGCYLFIHEGFSYMSVIYLGIVLSLARAVAALVIGWYCLLKVSPAFSAWRSVGFPIAWERTCITAPNRILGTLQTQTPPLVIGVLLGPASAGVYDVLTRLPRFAKSVLGLLNSAVLPFTSRLEAAKGQSDVTRLVENGLVWMAYLSAPPLFAAATFSKPLLGLWIGKEMVAFWLWQSIAFTTPLLTVLLGFGANVLFGRVRVYKMLNGFIVVRIILQFAIAFALMALCAERAFILGGVIATAATALWEFRLIFREHSVSSVVIRQLLLIFGIGILLTALFIPLSGKIASLAVLFFAVTGYTLFFWGLAWVLVIPAPTKSLLLKHIRRTAA